MAWGRPAGIADLIEKVEKKSVKSMAIMPFRKLAAGDGMKLAQALKGNTALEELLMSGHKIDLETAKAFGEALASNSTLQVLAIGDSSMGDDILHALLTPCAANQALHTLDLGSKGLTAQALGSVAAWLKTSRLRSLDLSRNNLAGQGAFATWADCGTGPLQQLHLSNCSLGDADLQSMAESVKAASHLQLLDLSGNNFTAVGAAALGNVLAQCRQLTELRLVANEIGDAGLQSILAGLTKRGAGCPPVSLHVERTGLGAQCGAHFAEAFSQGLALHHLSLAHNTAVTSESLGALLEAASKSEGGLTSLDLTHLDNAVLGASPAFILGLLGRLHSLEKVCLFGCNLGSSGLDHLLSVLSSSSTHAFDNLTELDVCGNNLDFDALLRLFTALRNPSAAPKLLTLVVGANPGAKKAELLEPHLKELFDVRPDLDVAYRAKGQQNNEDDES